MFQVLSELKKILASCVGLKSKWNKRTPKAKWQMIHDIGSFTAKIIQVNLYTHQKLGPLAFTLGAVCFNYYVVVLYTVYFYHKNNQFKDCLPCFCLMGVITTVSGEN